MVRSTIKHSEGGRSYMIFRKDGVSGANRNESQSVLGHRKYKFKRKREWEGEEEYIGGGD